MGVVFAGGHTNVTTMCNYSIPVPQSAPTCLQLIFLLRSWGRSLLKSCQSVDRSLLILWEANSLSGRLSVSYHSNWQRCSGCDLRSIDVTELTENQVCVRALQIWHAYMTRGCKLTLVLFVLINQSMSYQVLFVYAHTKHSLL